MSVDIVFVVIVLSLKKEWYPDVIPVGSIEHGPLLNDLPVHVKPAVPYFLAPPQTFQLFYR